MEPNHLVNVNYCVVEIYLDPGDVRRASSGDPASQQFIREQVKFTIIDEKPGLKNFNYDFGYDEIEIVPIITEAPWKKPATPTGLTQTWPDWPKLPEWPVQKPPAENMTEPSLTPPPAPVSKAPRKTPQGQGRLGSVRIGTARVRGGQIRHN